MTTKSSILIWLTALFLCGCDFLGGNPPADDIKQYAQKYANVPYDYKVQDCRNINDYMKTLDGEKWKVYEVEVSMVLDIETSKAIYGQGYGSDLKKNVARTVSVGCIKRGKLWYYRKM